MNWRLPLVWVLRYNASSLGGSREEVIMFAHVVMVHLHVLEHGRLHGTKLLNTISRSRIVSLGRSILSLLLFMSPLMCTYLTWLVLVSNTLLDDCTYACSPSMMKCRRFLPSYLLVMQSSESTSCWNLSSAKPEANQHPAAAPIDANRQHQFSAVLTHVQSARYQPPTSGIRLSVHNETIPEWHSGVRA